MDQVMPWAALCALIEPFYPKLRADGGGRPVVGLERMLRIHFLQQWYALSDPAVEEALYDSTAMRRFVGIDLGRESAPDETTVCKFRHLLDAVTCPLAAVPAQLPGSLSTRSMTDMKKSRFTEEQIIDFIKQAAVPQGRFQQRHFIQVAGQVRWHGRPGRQAAA